MCVIGENYCRYPQGKEARKPVVARQSRPVVVLDDDEEFRSEEARLTRTRCSLNGCARDYELLPNAVVYDNMLTCANMCIMSAF